jgi:hypothetical protein
MNFIVYTVRRTWVLFSWMPQRDQHSSINFVRVPNLYGYSFRHLFE